MNEQHLVYCSSAEWADTVQQRIVPWVVDTVDLGEDVLEVGPGPGLTTDALRIRVPRLTAVEVDHELAAALATRMAGSNVEVVRADATDTGLPGDRFSGAVCLTMLHHVPSAAHQDALFAEVLRLLRPGGVLIGRDSLDSPEFRELHVGDICVPVDPATLADRLGAAGFERIHVLVDEYGVRFHAYRPSPAA